MKKLIALLLALICLTALAAPALADWTELVPESADVNMPGISVFFTPVDENGEVDPTFCPKASELSAALGGEPLEVVASEPYAGGTAYFFLIDISGSVSDSDFRGVKDSLSRWVYEMEDNDKFLLITFGEEVTVVLNGSESRAAAQTAIEALDNSDGITRFYDGAAKAVDLAKTTADLPEHRVALVVTDGKDVSDAGSTTLNELSSKLKNASLPLYAIGLGNNKTYLDALGELARSSGGLLYKFDRKDSLESFLQAYSRINSCCQITLKADSNIVDKSEKLLTIRYDGSEGQAGMSMNLKLENWQPDTKAPKVKSIRQEGEKNIKITFSEDVIGADNPANYTLTDRTQPVEGQKFPGVPIASVSYDAKSYEANILLAEPIYAGEHALILRNITDRSMEKNALSSDARIFEATGRTREEAKVEEQRESIPPVLIAVVALLVIAVIAIICILAVRKKKQAEAAVIGVLPEDQEQVIVRPVTGRQVNIRLMEASGTERRITASIATSYVVGRSEGCCDLVIKDSQMSRQHFKLYIHEFNLFIEDMGSTNGTLVNSMPIAAPRVLGYHDIVEAGNTRFLFELV
ncbi:MAG: VWA domain-containing protein [Clostridia bacterium]|nr:VWA domain-containing protein [Clostridia bacterium]